MKIIIRIILYSSILSVLFGCGQKSDNKNLQNDISVVEIDTSLVLLTIKMQDCDACNLFFDLPYFKNYNLKKINIDIMENYNNRILSQALWTKAFPTTYFINSEYEILGITEGPIEFESHADSICNFNTGFENIEMDNIKKDSVLFVLSHSLKALRNYSDNNMLDAKKNVLLSISKGSYFFNNYLLYRIYEIENQKDSMAYYKRNALKHSHHVNHYIYDTLIEELNDQE